MFRSSHFCYYRVTVQVEGIRSHHTLHKLYFRVKVTVSRLIVGPLLIITLIQ